MESRKQELTPEEAQARYEKSRQPYYHAILVAMTTKVLYNAIATDSDLSCKKDSKQEGNK